MFILVFIAILTLLVFVHELGHFIAAKKNGILVEEFGFGFPPRVWGKKIGETLYSINLLPIGGFVKLYGEEYHEDGKVHDKLSERTFYGKKPWQKAIVVVAGVVMNFMLAWVLVTYLFTQGVPTPVKNVVIEQVQPGTPAAKAGIVAADVITELRYQDKTYSLQKSDDLIKYAKQFGGQTVHLTIQRDGKQIKTSIIPRANPPKGQGALGVVITSFVEKKYPIHQAPFYGLKHAFEITFKIIEEFGKTAGRLLSGQGAGVEVAGPVGIAQYTGTAIKFGHNAVLELMALLSLNLAVINILPFPALDGGRLVFIIYEWVTRRQVNKKFEQYTNMAGMAALLTLAAVITLSDLSKLEVIKNAIKAIGFGS